MKERLRNITPMFRGLSPILLIHFLFFCSGNCLAGSYGWNLLLHNIRYIHFLMKKISTGVRNGIRNCVYK